MDKNALKKYAIWARRELITRVSQRATFYGAKAQMFNGGCASKGGERPIPANSSLEPSCK